MVFEKFTLDEKKKILELIRKNINSRKPFLAPDAEGKLFSAGYLKDSFIGKINKTLSNIEIADMVFVLADYKSKQLQTLKAYIKMDEDIIPISQIPLLETPTQKTNNLTTPYFYLYYKIKENKETCEPAISNDAELIRQAVTNYFYTSLHPNKNDDIE